MNGSRQLGPLVHVAAFDWLSLPSSPIPRPAATAVIDREGRRVNWTSQWLTDGDGAARQCGRSRPYASASMSNLAQVTSRYPLPVTVLAGCSDQGHFPDDFLTATYEHVRSSSFSADILASSVLIRACVLYIGLQIFTLWQKSKVGVRIIFDGVLYSKFYGIFYTFNSVF